MKNILILNILLFLCIITNAQVYETSTQMRRIGYTTNYGNSFSTQRQNVSQITYGIGAKQPSAYHANFGNVNRYGKSMMYGGSYTPVVTTTSGGYNPGPRRTKERPDPGHDLGDWWRMNAPNWLGGNTNWPMYVDADYWDEFFDEYGDEYEDYVRDWFENHPGFPNDPFATPLEGDLLVLGIFALLYCLYQYKIRKTAS